MLTPSSHQTPSPGPAARLELDELNAMHPADFVRAMTPVFEGAVWVAERASEIRPFPTVAALHQAMFDEVLESDDELQLEFLRSHPDLGGRAARQRTMGMHSTAEQAALGLDRMDEAGFARFASMNEAYRARFGFPFLICVRRHTSGSILRQFARRLAADPAAERGAALEEVFRVTRLRIASLVEGPGMPDVAGTLSTQVQDTASGRAAVGMKVDLFVVEDAGVSRVRTMVTDEDGRAELMADGGPLRIGVYELRFHLGAYFGSAAIDPPFLDVVPVRIGIAEAEARYHMPLLASPWTYAVFRGG